MIATLENFGLKKLCKICKLEDDTTTHIFSCLFLMIQVPKVIDKSVGSLKDVYNDDVDKMSNISKIFEKLWRKREEIIDAYP